MKNRKCEHCKVFRPIEMFSKNKRICDRCRKQIAKERREYEVYKWQINDYASNNEEKLQEKEKLGKVVKQNGLYYCNIKDGCHHG